MIRGTADQSFSSQPQDGKLNIPTLKTSCGSFSLVGVQTVFHVFFFFWRKIDIFWVDLTCFDVSLQFGMPLKSWLTVRFCFVFNYYLGFLFAPLFSLPTWSLSKY